MKWIFMAALISLFAACQKENTIPANTTPQVPTAFPPRTQSPFGVMIEGIPESARLTAAKALGISAVRAEIKLENFTTPGSYIDSLVTNNFGVVANFNYYGAQKGAPFPTNQSAITQNINKAVQTFHPQLVAVENEEVNENYHTGAAHDYINELATATAALHAHNIKVTNGGLTEEALCILVYRNYVRQGLMAQANDFAKRTMPQAIITDLPALYNNARLANRVAFTDSLVQAYKNMNFDYVNFHWYEPVLARWTASAPNANSATDVDTKAMGEVISFLQSATGKPVITNETGELNATPGIVKDMLQQFKKSNLPFVVWYSGDGTVTGNMAKAVALNNSNGSLRSNGQAFRDFLQSNYGTHF